MNDCSKVKTSENLNSHLFNLDKFIFTSKYTLPCRIRHGFNQ